MKLANVLQELHIELSYCDILASNWETSVASLTGTEREFLAEKKIITAAVYCQLDSVTVAQLPQAIKQIMKKSALLLLVWHFYQSLCRYPEETVDFSKWPRLNNALGDDAGLFYLLPALAAVPLMQQQYRQLDIPEDIIYATLQQLQNFNESHKIGYGAPGLDPMRANWLRHYLGARLFRLGRMEYKLRKMPNWITVYRNKRDRSLVGFITRELNFDADGYVTRSQSEKVWSSTPVIVDTTTITGSEISPLGFSLNRLRTLERAEWDTVLMPGDTVIDMHIPGGGGLDLINCGRSMREAVDFFDHRFSEVKTAAIYCVSWIFNTQLKSMLPDSNLVKFMNELFLFPVYSEPDAGFYFIFCRKYGELKNPPRATRLQRGILDILDSGDCLRAGGMLFFKDDISKFGSQIYLNDK